MIQRDDMIKKRKTVIYCYSHAFMAWRRRLAGIYRYAHKVGWSVIAIEASDIRKMLRSTRNLWNADGFIVEDGVFGECGLRMDDFSGQMVVYCGRERFDGLWRVIHDSYEVASCAVKELLSLNLKSYAYVGFRIRTIWSRLRESVFVQEFSKKNVLMDVFDPCKFKSTTFSADFYNPLKEWLMNLPKPCGIFAANDEMGVHVLRAANELGIAVPDALSVLSIDNDELICDNCTPPLASVSVAFEHAGLKAAELLDRQMQNPSASPETIVFGSSKVISRASLGRFAKRDAAVFRALEFIRLNACGSISVTDVIKEMGVCRRGGELRFRMTTGHSINDEILSVRFEKAKSLLADARFPIDRIHTMCGYRDGRSLRYLFQRATGMGMREWRSIHATDIS